MTYTCCLIIRIQPEDIRNYNMKLWRCGIIANESNLRQKPNDIKVNRYL